MIDLARIEALLERHELDGLLVVDPDSFRYLSGVSGFPVTMWRRAGPVAIVIAPTRGIAFVAPDALEAALRAQYPDAPIFTHALWMERVDATAHLHLPPAQALAAATAGRDATRFETYDQATVLRQIHAAVAAVGLLGRRLGIELESAPAADIDMLSATLEGALLENGSPLLRELRAIKSPREIELHRLAARVTEAGILGALEGIDAHTTAFDIQLRYREAVQRVALGERIAGYETASTSLNLGPHLWGAGHDPLRPAARGDLVQFDAAVHIHGTMSDIARTFSYGQAGAAARFIEDALLAGHAAGLEQLRPGRRFRDVYHAASAAVRDNGIPSYARGHLGHSIGSIYIEEWPFFSATEERELEPGMVVAFEMPYYANGIGGFQNENNYLITATGHESLNRLPMDLVEVG